VKNLLIGRQERKSPPDCLFEFSRFWELLAKFEQKVVVAGKRKNTLNSYIRHLAKLAFLYNFLPTKLDPYRVNDCLLLVDRGYNDEHPTVAHEGFLRRLDFLSSLSNLTTDFNMAGRAEHGSQKSTT